LKTGLRILSLAAAGGILAGASPPNRLEVEVNGLRNAKGVLHLCLTRNSKHFPDCAADPAAIKQSVDAGRAKLVILNGVPGGEYALSVFHDENRNRKLDTVLKIPREGFGFSRNPTIRFGPPSFNQVRFNMPAGLSRQKLRMQYLL